MKTENEKNPIFFDFDKYKFKPEIILPETIVNHILDNDPEEMIEALNQMFATCFLHAESFNYDERDMIKCSYEALKQTIIKCQLYQEQKKNFS